MSSWNEKTLTDLGSVSRGKSRHRPRNAEFLYGGKYPFIQTSDVKNANFYITEYSQTYSEDGLKQSKLWHKETLCITIAANIADTGILGIDACFPDSIIGFVAYDNVSDVRFVKYCFDLLQRKIKQISQGAAQDNLSMEKLATIKFNIPDYPIQKRIASILSAYDDLIENNLKRIKLLEEIAQRTYEEWFVKFRVNDEQLPIDEVTGLPFGWVERELDYFGNVITGKTPSTLNRNNFDGEIQFVKTPDMSNYPYVLETIQCLSLEGAKTQIKKYIPKNSLMISCIGSAGEFALASEDCQTNQQINSIVFYKDFYTFYFYCFARGLKPLLEAIGSNGATMTNVNKGKFEKILVKQPEESYLIRFHDIAQACFDQILCLLKQNQKLKQSRDILLPRLMSGTINVES